MATWLDVKNFVKGKYRISEEQEDFVKLEFGIDDARTQLIFIFNFSISDNLDYVRFFSAFAKQGDISPEQFMELAIDTGFGLGIMGGYMGYVHNVFLEDLDASEIDKALNVVTAFADQTEKRLALGDRF